MGLMGSAVGGAGTAARAEAVADGGAGLCARPDRAAGGAARSADRLGHAHVASIVGVRHYGDPAHAANNA